MIKTCPACSNSFNGKMRFCPHCGRQNTKAPRRAKLHCPRCDSRLDKLGYRGSELDICPDCHGLWLDSDEFAFHTSERDTFADPEIPRSFTKPAVPEKSKYLKCIHCDAVMVRRNFRKISGVLIDICRDHGVWLDAGELEQIRSFIANGGLNHSQDKKIAANSLEIQKVARETKDLKTVFKILNKFDVKRILLQGF